jgi:hypothetical protein
MDYEAQKVLDAELGSGERLLWSGKPAAGLRLRASDIFMIPFSLMWGGFAIFWEFQVVASGAPFFFMLWGVPFVLVGLYMIVGRFFVDSYQRSRTYYGVSDQRVLIVGGLMSRQVTSLALQGLVEMSLNERGDGSGDIVFGRNDGFAAGWPTAGWQRGRTPPAPSFELIAQVRQVYELIRGAKA